VKSAISVFGTHALLTGSTNQRNNKGGDLMAHSQRNRTSQSRERRFTVRGIRRDPPDMQKLGRALIGLAQAEAERQAQAEQTARDATPEVTSESEQQTGGDGDE
jgi:hypothetical protein